jgi:hypothetical protein
MPKRSETNFLSWLPKNGNVEARVKTVPFFDIRVRICKYGGVGPLLMGRIYLCYIPAGWYTGFYLLPIFSI